MLANFQNSFTVMFSETESHTSGGGLSSNSSSLGPFPQSRPAPVPDGRGSYERGSRSTLVYWREL